MAGEKKKTGTSGKGAYPDKAKKQTSGKSRTETKASSSNKKSAPVPKKKTPSSLGHQLVMIFLAVVAIFIAVCFIFPDKVGLLGRGFALGFFGLFGIAAVLVPVLLLIVAYFWRRDAISAEFRYRYLIALGVLILCAAMIHTFRGLALQEKYSFSTAFAWEQLKQLWTDSLDKQGGGFIGGALALLMICALGYPGALIFGILFLIVLTLALFGLTPIECLQRIGVLCQKVKEQAKLNQKKRVAARAAREQERAVAEAETDEEDEVKETAVPCRTKNANGAQASVGVGSKKPAQKAFEETAEAVQPSFASDSNAQSAVGQDAVAAQTDESEAIDGACDENAETNELPEASANDALDAEAEEVGECDGESSEDLEACDGSECGEDLDEDPEECDGSEYDEDLDEDPEECDESAYDENDGFDGDSESDENGEYEDGQDDIEILPPDPMVDAPLTEDDEAPEETLPPREYEFPSLDILQPPEEISKDESVTQELRENADKIIETLDNFRVHVTISHVSRGPTVTRYELEPAAGTRVRSILNLLDDISLSLATSGVRSDGIITGKSAIGIEVPNKIVNTVYIRELIEDERFVDAKSRLTTCLGMDVSGAPVYLDIAKMPHLLIAGATGMGKSVCINSLLVSLLYKARPNEVKLILIDPKKVELNIYNGIPHLLVPVVFDPKKAAGALHWAVTEMERRFELIESKNTRNIAQYNAVIADDPTQEVLPQIVIVIDELADLMMSAPDDVEASICRLAQKARAAGMHLIIGTQRPSVDVITGLIKANIPSRIAFTVASQIDSRTIIDTQGAEKLIGRGDMLYAPVGASKPIRVQGSFVSETEIEEIVGFIRAQGYGKTYSDDVMAQINRAAEICGQKKNKGGMAASVSEGGPEDNDPMLDSAIELAVEMGKISTSQMQRRLQIGYGRAAKLIDIMERRGIVSAPDGQRPRNVLITREQYLEMQMSRSNRTGSHSDTSF